jgi:hypothetical protein
MDAHPLQGSRPAAVMPTPALAERVTRANQLYHACAYGTLARALPDLLADLHAAVAAASPRQRSGLLRLTAQAYYPACTLLLKSLGYTDLAFLAVTRAADVTAELDDPFYRALSGFFHTHVLMAAGSPDQAYAHAQHAADQVETNLHDQATGRDRAPLALLGELHLIRATALTQQVHRAGSDRTDQVRAHLREAHALAARTGETRAWHLNFGPINNSACSSDSAPSRWNASGNTFRSSNTSSCRAITGCSSGFARAAGSCRNSACSTAMKWLLPQPNEPDRNAPRLTPDVSASATRPSARSNASANAGVTTYSASVRHRHVIDAVGQPQDVVLRPACPDPRTSLSSTLIVARTHGTDPSLL